MDVQLEVHSAVDGVQDSEALSCQSCSFNAVTWAYIFTEKPGDMVSHSYQKTMVDYSRFKRVQRSGTHLGSRPESFMNARRTCALLVMLLTGEFKSFVRFS